MPPPLPVDTAQLEPYSEPHSSLKAPDWSTPHLYGFQASVLPQGYELPSAHYPQGIIGYVGHQQRSSVPTPDLGSDYNSGASIESSNPIDLAKTWLQDTSPGIGYMPPKEYAHISSQPASQAYVPLQPPSPAVWGIYPYSQVLQTGLSLLSLPRHRAYHSPGLPTHAASQTAMNRPGLFVSSDPISLPQGAGAGETIVGSRFVKSRLSGAILD